MAKQRAFEVCPKCVALQDELPTGEKDMIETIQPVIVRGCSAAPEGKPFCCSDCGQQVLWAYIVGLMGMQMICTECMTRWFEILNA
jgi:hypothetical protein